MSMGRMWIRRDIEAAIAGQSDARRQALVEHVLRLQGLQAQLEGENQQMRETLERIERIARDAQ